MRCKFGFVFRHVTMHRECGWYKGAVLARASYPSGQMPTSCASVSQCRECGRGFEAALRHSNGTASADRAESEAYRRGYERGTAYHQQQRER